jgi:hypothetical protein
VTAIAGFREPPSADLTPRDLIFRLHEWLLGDVAIPHMIINPDEPELTVVRPEEIPDIVVTCRARPEDGGILWFFDGDRRPFIEADNVADAAVFVRSRALDKPGGFPT